MTISTFEFVLIDPVAQECRIECHPLNDGDDGQDGLGKQAWSVIKSVIGCRTLEAIIPGHEPPFQIWVDEEALVVPKENAFWAGPRPYPLAGRAAMGFMHPAPSGYPVTNIPASELLEMARANVRFLGTAKDVEALIKNGELEQPQTVLTTDGESKVIWRWTAEEFERHFPQ